MVDTVRGDEATLQGEAGVARAAARSPPDDVEPEPKRLGRYLVLGELGRGGMGIVFAAYDPELDRKVAIKLLDPRRDDLISRTRLLREAQAMAKLQHPNVVAVHDVGTIDGSVFVAMEFVRGRTLTAHLAERQRPWREIVSAFVEAGRGLAAAHAEGLIHRDFKPDNVLVSNAGRVQVTDFGLARATSADDGAVDTEQDALASAITEARSGAASWKITKTGAMMGTPAYMAPEQYARQRSDARSDQFSFCVALYEALYGQRPFTATSLPELATAVLEGRIQPIPRPSRIPLWLSRVVLRGLASDPQARWSDMSALLLQLGRDPARTRTRIALVAVGSSLLVGGFVLTRQGPEPGPACEDRDALLTGVWDDARRASVRRAFAATGIRYAEDTWTRTEPLLDAYATEWADLHVRTCEAHWRRALSDELFDRKMACLRQRRSELDAIAGVLAEADATVVQNATGAASLLADVEACDDDEALWAEVDPPLESAVAERVGALRARLAGARVTANAGQVKAAREEYVIIVDEAQSVGYEPLIAEARAGLGWIHDREASYGPAESELLRGWEGALATGHERIAAEAAANLVLVVGVRQARVDEGLWWARYAKALVAVRHQDETLAASFRANLGNLYRTRGDHSLAVVELRAVVEILERTQGPDNPDVARQLSALGLALAGAGDYAAAYVELERALETQVRVLGPEHPEVATTLNNLGKLRSEQGEYREARAHHERALKIRLAAFGREHPDTASSHTNLGIALRHLGELDNAVVHLREAAEIKATTLGATDPQVAGALTNLGNAYFERGDWATAATEYQRAHDIYLAAFGPDHMQVALALNNLGTVAWKRGELDQARSSLTRAVAVLEQAAQPNRPLLASALLGLGEVALAAGRTADATSSLERSLELLDDAGSQVLRAQVRFALARAVVQGDPARAFELAGSAETAFREAGPAQKPALEQVMAFVAANRRRP